MLVRWCAPRRVACPPDALSVGFLTRLRTGSSCPDICLRTAKSGRARAKAREGNNASSSATRGRTRTSTPWPAFERSAKFCARGMIGGTPSRPTSRPFPLAHMTCGLRAAGTPAKAGSSLWTSASTPKVRRNDRMRAGPSPAMGLTHRMCLPDKRYPCLKSSEICHKLPAAQQAAAPPPATEPRPEEPKPTIKKRKSSEEQASDKRPRMESESPPDVGQPTGVRVPHPQKQKAPDEPARGKEKAARVEVPAPRAVPVEPTKHPLPKPTDVAAIGAEKTAALAQPVQSKPFNTRIPKRPADASLSPEAGSPPQASVPKAANVVPAAGPAAVGRAPPRGEAMATLAQWQQTSRQGQAPPAVLRVDGVPPAMVPGEWQAALKAARVVHKSTALGGWTLPDGTWRGNGSAYVLCDRASAQQTLTQLSGAVLKVSGVPGVRPLVCEQCDLHRLIPPNPPPPLPGHMSTAAPDMNSTRAARIGAGALLNLTRPPPGWDVSCRVLTSPGWRVHPSRGGGATLCACHHVGGGPVPAVACPVGATQGRGRAPGRETGGGAGGRPGKDIVTPHSLRRRPARAAKTP